MKKAQERLAADGLEGEELQEQIAELEMARAALAKLAGVPCATVGEEGSGK